MNEQRGRGYLLAAILGLAATGLGTVIGAGILLETDNKVFAIPSAGMRPTLQVGEFVVVDRGHEIRDGDIVVFHAGTWDEGTRQRGEHVKRVIGRGGETVACCTAGAVTRDGVALVEPYLATSAPDELASFHATKVPAGRLWVLGDNRGNSSDSRFHLSDANHGTVAEQDVVGVVVTHGSRLAVYGYVVQRGALAAVPVGLLVGIFVALLHRVRRRAAGVQGAVEVPAGTVVEVPAGTVVEVPAGTMEGP